MTLYHYQGQFILSISDTMALYYYPSAKQSDLVNPQRKENSTIRAIMIKQYDVPEWWHYKRDIIGFLLEASTNFY